MVLVGSVQEWEKNLVGNNLVEEKNLVEDLVSAVVPAAICKEIVTCNR